MNTEISGLPDEQTRRRKRLILIFGTMIFFFSSMSKVMVPAPIFNQLQTELGFSADQIALIGSCFMYAYAFSQLALGVFSDNFGGVRLLLIGGTSFALGQLLFPFAGGLVTMCIFRVIAALGAGTIFLGVAKLIADLYPDKFGMVLGIVLLVSYLGPVSGILPLTWMIQNIPWRHAYLIIAVLSAVLIALIAFFSRGILRPVGKGNALAGLLQVIKQWRMWMLYISSSLIFGAYYALLIFAGQKCLQDISGFPERTASACMTVCALIVAIGNILSNLVMKWLGDRRKTILYFGTSCSLAGACFGYAIFFAHLPVKWLILPFLLIAIPAGFFSIFSTVAKELNRNENIGLSVSLLNFWAFVAIAGVSHAAGILMDRFESAAQKTASGMIYPAAAYQSIFLFLTILALIGFFCVFFIPETKPSRMMGELQKETHN